MLEFSGIIRLEEEKIANRGEDAMSYCFDKSGSGYMFVFDGCGGAGSPKHLALEEKKSAYIASRSCALFLDKYLENTILRSDADIEAFGQRLHSYLVRINEYYPMESSESTLVDVLPTTISGILVSNTENGLFARFIWAGDSRGYLFDENGISQVTEDDVNSEDAFTNITDDSIMSNRIHGNKNKPLFKLHSVPLKINKKCMLLCSTDGCYDYFNSPMVFEFLIVSVIMAADCFADAEANLRKILKEQSGDDCSLIIAIYGFLDYSEFKSFVYQRYLPLNTDKGYFGQAHGKEYWETKYKKNYYRYNPLRRNTNG